jgi:muramoyltetrapeptide carboxypeptidase
MPGDIMREGGEAAVARALDWLVSGAEESLEPGLGEANSVAFNITVFSQLLGTPLQPDLKDHVLMLEDVSEHLYRTDRSLFHITSNPGVREVAGHQDGAAAPRFRTTIRRSAKRRRRSSGHWCERSKIPYLGRADIGHDADNKVVPFGHRSDS